MSNIKIFFPHENLNPQGWVTDFLTSQIKSTDTLAQVLYHPNIDPVVAKEFNISPDLLKDINRKRVIKDEQMFSLNPYHHDEFESTVLSSRDSKFEKVKYKDYVQFFSNIDESQLAVLYPRMRFIYRFKKKAEDKNWTEIPLPFEIKTNIKDITGNRFSRGDGAGIEGITVKRDFSTYAYLKVVNVSARFYFQSINILTRERPHSKLPADKPFSFIKLIGSLPSKTEQILLEYGWGVNKDVDASIIPSEFRRAIELRERKRFPLRYGGHNFSFDQDGSVKLGVEYFLSAEADLFSEGDTAIVGNPALMEATIKNKSTRDAAKSYLGGKKRLEEINKELNKEGQASKKKGIIEVGKKGSDAKKNSKKKDKKMKELVDEQRELSKQVQALRKLLAPKDSEMFINYLIAKYQMFMISFESKEEEKDDDPVFTVDGNLHLVVPKKGTKDREFLRLAKIHNEYRLEDFDFSKTTNKLANLTPAERVKAVSGAREAALKMFRTTFNTPVGFQKGKEYGHTMFFPLRALVGAVLDLLPVEERKKVPFVGLGNMIGRSFNREYSLNIGDVLIEVKTFQKWYYENAIKAQRVEYSFIDFMNDITDKLIPAAVYNNSTILSKSNIGPVKRTLLYIDSKPSRDLLFEVYKSSHRGTFKKLLNICHAPNTLGIRDVKSLVYYHQVTNAMSKIVNPYLSVSVGSLKNFNESRDAANGIPHLKIGAANGVLKSMDFSSEDMPGLRKALWDQTRSDSAATVLKYTYTANAKMFGSNLFFKGGYFAVPANPLGIVGAYDPGIVGYYGIHNTTDVIDANGSYETSIEGMWIHNPEDVKEKKNKAVAGDNKTTEKLKDFVWYDPLSYIKDSFENDPNVLKRLGLTKETKPEIKKKSQPAKEKQKAGSVAEKVKDSSEGL